MIVRRLRETPPTFVVCTVDGDGDVICKRRAEAVRLAESLAKTSGVDAWVAYPDGPRLLRRFRKGWQAVHESHQTAQNTDNESSPA